MRGRTSSRSRAWATRSAATVCWCLISRSLYSRPTSSPPSSSLVEVADRVEVGLLLHVIDAAHPPQGVADVRRREATVMADADDRVDDILVGPQELVEDDG